MTTPNPYLEEVRMDMERARSAAEAAKRVYNEKAALFNQQLKRYEHLKVVELDERLALEREKERAIANGNATVAALLSR